MSQREVWKYQFVGGEETFEMPEGAEVLTAQMQGDALRRPVLWALVDPDRPKTRRRFVIIGTGNGVGSQALRYIATVQKGPTVGHVFERLEH